MKEQKIKINSLLLLSSLLFSIVVVAITFIFFVDLSLKREIEYILSVISFFLFLVMFFGLYFATQISYQKIDTKSAIDKVNFDWVDVGSIEIDESIIGGILAWVFASIIAAILTYLFSLFVWGAVVLLVALFNWVFYRALRLVFKKRNECRGNVFNSFKYALMYTLFYTCWIFIMLEVIAKYVI